MNNEYWKRQDVNEPLFPGIEWSRPEQRDRAGRLGIIGGNTQGFAGVAESYGTAINTGVGHAKVILPATLKKTIPAIMTDVVFADTNPSGGLSKKALPEMLALGQWSDSILLVGDAGRNSETAILYEEFLQKHTGKIILTRDAIDLIKNSPEAIVERPDTFVVAAFAQLQKLFQSVYYPKVLTFSMNLSQLVEALHKFTITYPLTIAVLHKEHLVIAHDGEVTSTEWGNAMAIWRGVTASKIAAYWIWNPDKPLESATTAILR